MCQFGEIQFAVINFARIHFCELSVCEIRILINYEPVAGGQRMASRRWPTKLVMSWEAVGDVQLCTCKEV